MFTKRKHVGSMKVDKYETVTDWGAVFKTGLVIIVILALIGSCAG